MTVRTWFNRGNSRVARLSSLAALVVDEGGTAHFQLTSGPQEAQLPLILSGVGAFLVLLFAASTQASSHYSAPSSSHSGGGSSGGGYSGGGGGGGSSGGR